MKDIKLKPWSLGFNVLLMGPPGGGKTSAIPTLLKTGLEVFVIFTEAGVTNLLQACRLHKCTDEEMTRLHWKYVKPGTEKFSSLAKHAKDVNVAAEFGKMPGGSRKDFGQLIAVMKQCANFIDQNEISYGAADEWDATRVLVIDGLSGLNKMAMDLVVGSKPVKTLQDWGVAIDQEEKLILQCCDSICNFVLICHLDQEKDDVTGSYVITAAALGNKLGNRLGRTFNDVILATAKDGHYLWSTKDKRTTLKHSNLALSDSLVPDFQPLVGAWLKENEE